eukprot:7822539-Pyramimonas_sp.AAC.1
MQCRYHTLLHDYWGPPSTILLLSPVLRNHFGSNGFLFVRVFHISYAYPRAATAVVPMVAAFFGAASSEATPA